MYGLASLTFCTALFALRNYISQQFFIIFASENNENFFVCSINRVLCFLNIRWLLWNKNRYTLSELIFKKSIKFWFWFIGFHSSETFSDRPRKNKCCIQYSQFNCFVQTFLETLKRFPHLTITQIHIKISGPAFLKSNTCRIFLITFDSHQLFLSDSKIRKYFVPKLSWHRLF